MRRWSASGLPEHYPGWRAHGKPTCGVPQFAFLFSRRTSHLQKSPCASRPSTGLPSPSLCYAQDRLPPLEAYDVYPQESALVSRAGAGGPARTHPATIAAPLRGGVAEGRGGFRFASHVGKGGLRGIFPASERIVVGETGKHFHAETSLRPLLSVGRRWYTRRPQTGDTERTRR